MRKLLARGAGVATPAGVNIRRFFGSGLLAVVTVNLAGTNARGAEAELTRPGQITVTALTGEATVTTAGQTRPAKIDDRVRVDARVATGRRSLVSLTFSNGAVLEVGTDSEVEIEELLQAPHAGLVKPEAMKAEPSVSRTRVRLVRGELRLAVKPLLVARGSLFVVALPAGGVRVDEGALYALARMTETGLGLCALECDRGTAEFEPAGGGAPVKLPVGRRREFAVEVDRRTGEVKLGEMPKAPGGG